MDNVIYQTLINVTGVPYTIDLQPAAAITSTTTAADQCTGFKPPYYCTDVRGPQPCDMYPALQRPNGCWYLSPWQKFLTYTVAIGVVALCGLIGNTLSIIVLMKDNTCTCNSGVLLLKVLAFTDNTFLVLILCYYSLWAGLLPYLDQVLGYGYYEVYLRALPYVRSSADQLLETAQTAVIWITVLLAVNRYIAVCYPLHAPRYCTRYKAYIQVTIVLLASVIFNIPNFCRNHLSYTTVQNYRTGQNETLACVVHNTVVRSDMFRLVYTKILSTIMLGALPLLLLVILNVRIMYTIRGVTRFQRQNSTRSDSVAASETNISVVMVTIIVVFILCQTADRLRFAVGPLNRFLGCHYPITIPLINLFVVFNSSVNFIIYFFLRRSFRQILCTVLPLGGRCRETGGARSSVCGDKSRDAVIFQSLHKKSANGITEQVFV